MSLSRRKKDTTMYAKMLKLLTTITEIYAYPNCSLIFVG